MGKCKVELHILPCTNYQGLTELPEIVCYKPTGRSDQKCTQYNVPFTGCHLVGINCFNNLLLFPLNSDYRNKKPVDLPVNTLTQSTRDLGFPNYVCNEECLSLVHPSFPQGAANKIIQTFKELKQNCI